MPNNKLKQLFEKNPFWGFFLIFSIVFIGASFGFSQRFNWLPCFALSLALAGIFSKIFFGKGGGDSRPGIEHEFKRAKYAFIESSRLLAALRRQRVHPGDAIAETLAADSDVRTSLLIAFYRNRSEKWGRSIISFVLPKEAFPAGHELDTCKQAEDAMRREVLKILIEENNRLPTGDNRRMDEGDIENCAGRAIGFEIRPCDDLPSESVYWKKKLTVSGDTPIHYIFRNRNPAAANGGVFLQHLDDTSGREPVGYFLANNYFKILKLPSTLNTRLTDIICERDAEEFPVDQLINGGDSAKALLEKLDVELQPFAEPFNASSLSGVTRKGNIRAVGILNLSKEIIFGENQHRQQLHTRASIYCARNALELPPSRKASMILLPKLFDAESALNQIVYGAGNFMLEYLPTTAGSTHSQYHLKPLRGTTEYFRRMPTDPADAWKDVSRYTSFPENAWSKVPSDCYVRTYSAEHSAWLCLHIDIGSPGVANATVGNQSLGIIDGDEDLRFALRRFIKLRDMTDIRISDKTANGLVAEGKERNGQVVFLKLLDPAHLKEHRIAGIFELLQKNKMIPASVEAVPIDSDGARADHSGRIVFVTHKYQTLDALVGESAYEAFNARGKLCRALADYARRLIDMGVVCPDWDLSDTAFVTATEEPGWPQGGIFLVDYGSYMERDNLRVDCCLRKPEYEGPENWDHSLPFQAEPYIVFGLGILFLQILARQPKLAPSVLDDPDVRDKPPAYQQLLEKEMTTLLPKDAAAFSPLIIKMLSWDPWQRPLLSAVVVTLQKFV